MTKRIPYLIVAAAQNFRRNRVVPAILAALTTSCSNQPYLLSHTEASGQEIAGVLERIRQDVGNYETEANARRAQEAVDPDKLGPPDPKTGIRPPLKLVCPVDDYDFDVSKVTSTLQVYTSNTASGDFALKIPFGPTGLGSIGPDLGGKNVRTATQTLTFDRFYSSQQPQLPPQLAEATAQAARGERPSVTPISDTLLRLRTSLIQSAQHTPCFDVKDSQGNSSDTVKIDFIVERDADPSVGFNIFIVTAKAGYDSDTKDTSSLTVTFVPLAKPPAAVAPKSAPNRRIS